MSPLTSNKPFLAQSGLEKQRDVTLESGEQETILTADQEVGREDRRKMSSLVNSNQRYKSNMLRMSQCYSYKVLESS